MKDGYSPEARLKKEIMRLGIDFGTTRTVVACADRGNYPVLSFEDENGDARDYLPSLVAERDGELRFGFDAAAVAADPSFTVLRSSKRLPADPRAMPTREVLVGSTRLTLSELVVRYFTWLREFSPQRVARRAGPWARGPLCSRRRGSRLRRGH